VARTLIEDNQGKIHAMAKALLEWETIDGDQLDDIIAGKDPRPPKDWSPRNPSVGGGGNGPSGGSPAVTTDPTPTVA
jgi:cell division protease FtsH